MDLNKLKIKNIKDQLELGPNFPGVATPQSVERIVCIISYTYNPSTAPFRAFQTGTNQLSGIPFCLINCASRTIQYGYGKCGTPAGMFSQTCVWEQQE